MREWRAWVEDGDIQIICPGSAVALVHAPWVALVFHGAESVAKFGGEVAFHQCQVATHVENLVEDLDVYWADFVAGFA